MRQLCFFLLSLTIVLVGALPPGASHAAEIMADVDVGFDPNHILSDDDIFNVNGLSYDSLVAFLKQKGTLGDRLIEDIDSKRKPIADIIWRVANSYKINPKYLLVLLQKEQSLVEDPFPSQKQFDWATGYGVCDDCSKNDPALQNFKGFAAQLEWAAKQHREKYLIQLLTRGTTIGGQGKGKTVTIDNTRVTPVNHATAMLYSYTPHLHGNYNLWRIWQRWFRIRYPDGTVVRATPSGTFYLIRFGEKHPFASRAVLQSLVDEEKVITVNETDLQGYSMGSKIKFSQYALLQNPAGTIYLLVGNAKRRIVNMETFKKFGFNEDEVERVEDVDLAEYEDGSPITTATAFPQGVLMKTAGAPGVWYVEDGTRYPLLDSVLLKLYFRGRRIRTVSPATLETYSVSQSYRLHEGELVRSKDSATVYVVENGTLRAIPSAEIFERIGWKWKNIVTVPASLLNAHEVGAPFTLTSQIPDEQTPAI